MARGTRSFKQTLLGLSVATLLSVAGCGQVDVTENAAPSSNAPGTGTGGVGTTPTSPTQPTNPASGGTTPSTPSTPAPGGGVNPPAQAIGDNATATANQAVLTTTRTTVHNLNSGLLGLGGWQPAALLEDDHSADADSPRIQFDESGNGFAVWTLGNDAIARRYIASSATWAAPVVLDTRNSPAFQARLSVDRLSGNAIASWVQSNGTADSFYVSRYNVSTNSWGAPELLESSNNAVESGAENSNVFINGSQAAAAWRQFDGTAISVYLSRLVNGSWTTPVVVDATNQPALHPDLATDTNGNVILVWRQFDGIEYRIQTRRWNNATQSFNAVTPLDNEGDRQPRLGMDGNGNAFALWRGGGVYVRRFNAANSTWGPETSLHGGVGDTRIAELSVGLNGNAIAAWVENNYDQTGVASTSVFTRRYHASTGTWGDIELMENSVVPANPDKNPTVAINGEDGIVAWIRDDAVEASPDSVFARKLTNGVWGPVTKPELNDQRVDQLFSTVNSAGNAGLVWIQADGFSDSVYQARHLSSNFVVPNGATWQSLAQTLYGVNSVEAGSALQAALGGGPLVPGTILSGLPATLSVTTTVPGFYTVVATDTWSHIAQRVYGVTDVNAIAQLRALLGNPTLATGLQLVVPSSYIYVTSGNYSAPLDWSKVNTTATTYHSLNTSQLTIPLNNWSAQQLLETENGADAITPRIAFDANGNGIAVWGMWSDIVARRYTASTATWSEPVILDSNTNEAHAPRLSIDRTTGNAVVSWVQSDGTAESMYASTFNAASSTWSGAALLETSANEVNMWGDGSSASIGGSSAAVVWLQADGVATSVYMSRLVGNTWTAATQIDTSTEEAEQPEVAVDSNGNVTAVWRQFSPSYGENRIYSRRWNNTAQALDNVLTLSGLGDRRPRIAFDAQGNAIAQWGSGAFVRRYDASTGQWGTQVQLHTSEDGAWNNELAVDAAGNALSTWIQNDNGTNSVYASYFDAASLTWGTPVRLSNPNISISYDLYLTVALTGGNGVVAWMQEGTNTLDVYASRLAAGTWTAPTLLETREEGPSELASAVDNASNATVVWIQPDGAASSVYFARSNGTPYYVVPAGATWRSIANTLYSVNSDAAGSALQVAMGSPTLSAGLQLLSPPATLAVTPAVPTYYVVQAGDTWASVTLTLYGTSRTQAAAALQTLLNNPALTAGSWLVIPSTLSYSAPD